MYAGKKASRTYTTPWSPTFSRAWSLLHFYKLSKASLLNPGTDYTASITAWQQRYPHVPQTTLDLPTTMEGFRIALNLLRQAKQNAAALREKYLDDKAALYDKLEKLGKAKAVQRLKQAENLSRTYQKLQRIRTTDLATGLTEIRVPHDVNISPKECPDDDHLWRTERVPEEIEKLLIDRNRTHFGQAEGTPFTMPHIRSQLQYDGSGPMADLILEGDYDDTGLDEATRLFIKHLQRRTTTTLSGTISREEFMGKIKNWEERTSTSPSGWHLGHYHILWRSHGLKDEHPHHDIVSNGQTLLLDIHVALLNYALKFGHSYKAWQNVVNVMLLKEPGNPKIHRVRVIHLYEANYNLLLAVKWRQAMHHAEDHNLLNDGLYGSRAGRSAHEPVFLEILQNETYTCSMKSGINFDLDATSCYDRILACLATIASRRLGMTRQVVLVCAKTLEHAKFRLKTTLKITDTYYQHCEAYPIHGTGQGSGNSPHIWAFVSSTLFDAFQEITPGAEFVSFDGNESVTLHMVGFVDDCTQRANNFRADPQPTATELTNRMATEAQKWNDLLWSSGGALEIPKCSFHMIESEWRHDGTPFLRGGTHAPKLYVNNGLVPSQVTQKSNYKSHKTLGCHINPANRMTKQFEILKHKSDKAATMIQANSFTHQEARLYYRMIYLPSITYPLSVTSLSKADCLRIQTQMMTAIVPRCGYNRTMPKAIRYLPEVWGGAGMTEVETEQGLLSTLLALKYLRSPSSQCGKLLRITLSWAQAFSGARPFSGKIAPLQSHIIQLHGSKPSDAFSPPSELKSFYLRHQRLSPRHSAKPTNTSCMSHCTCTVKQNNWDPSILVGATFRQYPSPISLTSKGTKYYSKTNQVPLHFTNNDTAV
jgi:hypothetical protein